MTERVKISGSYRFMRREGETGRAQKIFRKNENMSNTESKP